MVFVLNKKETKKTEGNEGGILKGARGELVASGWWLVASKATLRSGRIETVNCVRVEYRVCQVATYENKRFNHDGHEVAKTEQ